MGFIEKFRQKLFQPKEDISYQIEHVETESQMLLAHFYANPFNKEYRSGNQQVIYKGAYEKLLEDYRFKKLPVLRSSNKYQYDVAFLWTDPTGLSFDDKAAFNGFIKPYKYVFYEISSEIETPYIEIISESNSNLGYNEYIQLWNQRIEAIKYLSL